MMREAWRLAAVRAALAAAFLAGVGLCAVPLLGVHGVESALVLGALLPPFVATACAGLTVHARDRAEPTGLSSLIWSALGVAWACWALPVALLALNALRVRNCTPWQGLAFMALGPGAGLCLAAILGVALGLWVRRGGLARTLAALLPVLAIVLAVWRFYATPAIFSFGHFFGYFPGTLYDPDVTIPTAYLSFRAVGLLWGAGLVLLLHASIGEDLQPRWRGWQSGRDLSLGLLLLAGAILATGLGSELGHRVTTHYIAEELGHRAEGRRCTVVVPREMERDLAQRLARDCDFRVEHAERTLEVRHRSRVTGFVFRSSAEKRRLMGASGTNIAKPWLHQVYLQRRGWPHPVMAHEIAHVVSGSAARGPFRVAAKLGGWWPNPALIEGVAVAVDWPNRDGMTTHQWAKAMLELGVAPSFDAVTGAGFLGQPQARAYTLSGSVVRFVLERYGARPIRRMYATGRVTAGLPLDSESLRREWQAYLQDEVALPAEALELARLRFEQPSIFSAICPHRVADLRNELHAALNAGAEEEAIDTCRQILDIDPARNGVRARLAGALARSGHEEGARAQLTRLLRPPRAPTPVRVSTRHALADAAWRDGRYDRALERYRALLSLPLTENTRRLLQVKAIALQAGENQRELLRELLIGPHGRGVEAATAVHLARELREVRADGLPRYLEARQLLFRHRYAHALRLLGEARRLGLPTPEVRLEALKLQAIAAYAQGRLRQSERHWNELLEQRDLSQGRQAEARDWLSRIEYASGLCQFPPDRTLGRLGGGAGGVAGWREQGRNPE